MYGFAKQHRLKELHIAISLDSKYSYTPHMPLPFIRLHSPALLPGTSQRAFALAHALPPSQNHTSLVSYPV